MKKKKVYIYGIAYYFNGTVTNGMIMELFK